MAFPEEVVAEAEQLANAPIPQEEYEKRLDLRSTPIFTIDSAHSKDLDDAVSLEKTAAGYKLGVHIADVSHYVRPNTPLNTEALDRGTSIYYANHVIPMLPTSLSNARRSSAPPSRAYTARSIRFWTARLLRSCWTSIRMSST